MARRFGSARTVNADSIERIYRERYILVNASAIVGTVMGPIRPCDRPEWGPIVVGGVSSAGIGALPHGSDRQHTDNSIRSIRSPPSRGLLLRGYQFGGVHLQGAYGRNYACSWR
jgi:hypothetical protein